MTAVGEPIVWRLSFTCPRERVFELLDTDSGRERFWAVRSHAREGSFELEFPGGLRSSVELLERGYPRRLALRYFGSRSVIDLEQRADGGCDLQVTCECDDPSAWLEFYPGWVSWLLVLKGAAEHGVDLRNGAPDRTWAQRYVDQ
jgi:hypothetical protein